MKILTLMVLFLTVSCASKLKPVNQRSTQIIKDDSNGYEEAVYLISSNIENPQKAIKYKNEKLKKIVLSSSVSCNIFRQSGDTNTYNLKFNLQAKFLGQKAVLDFKDMVITDSNGFTVGWDYNQISSKGKLIQSIQCLEDLIEKL